MYATLTGGMGFPPSEVDWMSWRDIQNALDGRADRIAFEDRQRWGHTLALLSPYLKEGQDMPTYDELLAAAVVEADPGLKAEAERRKADDWASFVERAEASLDAAAEAAAK